MRVLAIGATGFIGSHVVEQLAAQGHEVTVVHRGTGGSGATEVGAASGRSLPHAVRRILCERDALSSVRSELERFAPDVALDVIAYTESHARELVRTFQGIARRLVVLSSADVYRNYDGLRGKPSAPPDPVPLTEEAPLREALYPYRGSEIAFAHRDNYEKILVERAVMSEPGLPGTVLRLPAVYGPGDRQHRLRGYLRPMDDGRPAILLDREQARWRWTRGYVANVAAAIALVVTDPRAAGRIYNVGEESASSEREWIEHIGRVAGWKGSVVTLAADELPKHLAQDIDWRYDLATDTRRIREELHYQEPVSEQEALEATIAWERSQSADEERPDYAAEDAALAGRRS